jgi:hypothetical protein
MAEPSLVVTAEWSRFPRRTCRALNALVVIGVSHSRTVPSLPMMAISLPSGLKATPPPEHRGRQEACAVAIVGLRGLPGGCWPGWSGRRPRRRLRAAGRCRVGGIEGKALSGELAGQGDSVLLGGPARVDLGLVGVDPASAATAVSVASAATAALRRRAARRRARVLALRKPCSAGALRRTCWSG